ncbi:MAG: carbamoyltransferase [Candidatus Latescibacteria bacterium]|nr:carbamoyltransferase [Candidatus Latescibacterota bacterium]
MVILGLGDHIDCGSAILVDGRVLAAINDERLVREKMVFGVPRKSIRAVLELTGYRPDQIDAVAVGTRNQHLVPDYVDFRQGWFGLKRGRAKQLLFDVGSKAARVRGYIPGIEEAYYLVRQPFFMKRRAALRRILREEFGITAPMHFVDHHDCHATSAYYSSDFGPDATVFTVDGGGDGISSKAYDVRDGRFTELVKVPSFHSVGAFYSYITQICGFKAGRHEGKITGLAAHGKPVYRELLDSLLTYRNGTFVNTGNIFFHSALQELRKRLPENFDKADLSASVQVHSEWLVTQFAQHWVTRTGHRDVALAGGVFANVRVNQEVHELPCVERCFVHPGMSDCGMGIGAALAVHYDREPRPAPDTRCLDDVYLGPSYTDAEIESALREAQVDFGRSADLEAEIAKLLSQGAVVARFDGRMEYGPRALGNRSILYQPTDPSVNDWLNKALVRTEFMPFAPSTLEEEAGRCFHRVRGAERTARFMTITFDCKDFMKERCGGVVHLDGTARPQLVRKEDNPRYYRIIEEYRRITGRPSIINTSFNMHEEPIVCSPHDAIRAFKLGHLDYLAIGGFLARNSAPIDAAARRQRGATADALVRAGERTAS